MYSLEEFPPQKRVPPPSKKKAKDGSPVRLPGAVLGSTLVIALAILAGSGFWINGRLSRIEADVQRTRTGLDDAGRSLQLLWTTTTRLDESQGQRQELLRDSIEFVRDYVESEVGKLWQTAYLEHQDRLDRNARSIAQNSVSITKLLDASSRMGARVDAVSRRFAVQDADLQSLGQAIDGLRQTTLSLVDQYSGLEQQVAVERAARQVVDGRLQGVEQWSAGFRSEGLTARAVQTRIASLTADLRTVGQRLDSLKRAVDSVRVGTRMGVLGGSAAIAPGRPAGNPR